MNLENFLDFSMHKIRITRNLEKIGHFMKLRKILMKSLIKSNLNFCCISELRNIYKEKTRNVCLNLRSDIIQSLIHLHNAIKILATCILMVTGWWGYFALLASFLNELLNSTVLKIENPESLYTLLGLSATEEVKCCQPITKFTAHREKKLTSNQIIAFANSKQEIANQKKGNLLRI